MAAEIRTYEESDFDAIARHWREIGWIDDRDAVAEALRGALSAANVGVGVVDGEAEALAQWVPGSLRYLTTDLPLCVVAGVTASPVARQHKFASRLTARSLAHGVEAGMAVATLGIFDQGFYDRLGFGTGSYDHRITFDPAQLSVPIPDRTPVRLSADNSQEIHDLLERRHRGHGGVALHAPEHLRMELVDREKGFGLGYREDGRLTHFIYVSVPEYGVYHVGFLAAERPDQFLELLGLMKTLSDQVVSIRVVEPREMQMQDYLRRPFREAQRTKGADHANGVEAIPWYQMRILDVEKCLGVMRWSGDPLHVNLVVDDPAQDFLDGDWRGVAGSYVVSLSNEVAVSAGNDSRLETVSCSVNALTRWWLGVAPATDLSLLGGFEGPHELLARLDDGHRIPKPSPGVEF